MSKTKIICSIGPSSNTSKILTEMIEAGMDIARFNMSHSSHELHKQSFKELQKAIKKTGKKVSVMLDTKGPEIRIKDFKDGKVFLKQGQKFIITTKDVLGDEKQVSVSYDRLPEVLKKGDILYINDGMIKLQVEKTTKDSVVGKVINGGELSNKKSINIPGIETGMEFLNEKDKSDLAFAKDIEAEYIALSFVSHKEDVLQAREYLKSQGLADIKIISKIESVYGIENFDEILKVSDGIMVARGDLGVEIDFAQIPFYQKEMIKKCNKAKKFVVTATQMMETMTTNPIPTRAEVSDVANAVFDGTNAIMLSGETANGKHPALVVKTMRHIADEAEKHTK